MSQLHEGRILSVVTENAKHANGSAKELHANYTTTIAVHEPVEGLWFTQALGAIEARLTKVPATDPIWRGRTVTALTHMGTATIGTDEKTQEATIVTLTTKDKGCDIDTSLMYGDEADVARADWAEQRNTRMYEAAERLSGLVVDAANMYRDPKAAERHFAFLGHIAIPSSGSPLNTV